MPAAAESTGSASVTPSLEEVRGLAASYNLVPLRHSFIDDCETPVSAFLKLRGLDAQVGEGAAGEFSRPEGEPLGESSGKLRGLDTQAGEGAAGESGAFLLESAEQGKLFGRYSFIGLRPKQIVRWALEDGGDPYALAADAVGRYRQAPLDGLPPFAGGAVGFFGYDLVRTVETTLGPPNPDVLGLPDMALMLSDVLVVFDHLKHTVTILVNVYAESVEAVDAAYADAAATIDRVRARLAGPVPVAAGSPARGDDRPLGDLPTARAPRGAERPMPEFVSNMERAQFEGMVARIVEYVHAGDAFQVVPSQRWSADLGGLEAFSVYRGLRVVNPSPYMYFLDFGDFQIAGASPEPLLTVSGTRVSTRPIAGTRRRGATDAEDAELARELLADEKERSEHVMLVDLGRNDLGRVCEYGTVTVDTLMGVELYSTVMHIVSNVSGTLREDVRAIDALRSVLPAGTLSGAPKVRAMEIIDELESVKRGGYGGAIGYLSYTGDLDTCIHIRTVVVQDGRAHIQAGGGTVADARPDYEYEESVNKARAVKQAIELAARQPDWG